MSVVVLLRFKRPIDRDGIKGVLEVKVYKVPEEQVPHGFKYSLQFAKWTGSGWDSNFLRYDNFCGHTDHKHIKGQRFPYKFTDVDALIRDFNADARELLGFELIPWESD